MNDLLADAINHLQHDYKNLLTKVESDIFGNNTRVILDDINVFWLRNKRVVQCILRNLSLPYRTYLFTAATILDIKDHEHYPFLCFGDYHIWDDPIYEYIRMIYNSNDLGFNARLKKQVLQTIGDNINILEKVNDKIIILPVRLLSGVDMDFVHSAAQHTFLDLFSDQPSSLDDYYQKLNSIDEICSALREGVAETIILGDHDDTSADLKQRFLKYKSESLLPFSKDESDAFVFAFALQSYLAQALDILLVCSEYSFIPYIRFDIAMKYLLLLASNLPEEAGCEFWLFRSTIAHLLHHSFDKKRYKDIEVDEFVKKIRNANFENRVFASLQKNNVSLHIPAIELTIAIIQKELAECFPVQKNKS